jgi:hypothetical protein
MTHQPGLGIKSGVRLVIGPLESIILKKVRGPTLTADLQTGSVREPGQPFLALSPGLAFFPPDTGHIDRQIQRATGQRVVEVRLHVGLSKADTTAKIEGEGKIPE